ncbi:MAG: hypothetical protein IJ481_02085 [Alphaproteobacteria bacterium]|nr:hypothetical protein [Alphaproteobacteria bacterium]
MDKKIDLIKKETRKPAGLVKKFKKQLISATIEDYAKNNDLTHSYKKLIAGLDQASIDTVHKILLRELQTAKCKSVTFTQEETEQLAKLNNTFRL